MVTQRTQRRPGTGFKTKTQNTKEKGKKEGEKKGLLQGQVKMLLRQGTKRFGSPTAATRAALKAITDSERLEQLGERILDVGSWSELLAGD